MRTIRGRLTLSHTVLVLISIIVFGFYMMEFIENLYMKQLTSQTISEARIVASAVSIQPTSASNPSGSSLAPLWHTEGTRLSLVGRDGRVRAGVPVTVGGADLSQTQTDGLFSAIRYDESDDTQSLFVIVPTKVTEASTGDLLYVVQTVPLTRVQAVLLQLWEAVGWSLLVLGIVTALVCWRLARSIADPIGQITSIADQIAQGNVGKRVHLHRSDELATLGQAVNTLAERMNVQIEDLLHEKSKLESILAHMVNGVIVVDQAGRISLINRAMENMFGYGGQDVIGRWHWEAGQSRDLSVAIDQAILHGKSSKREIQLRVPVERTVEINVTPVYQSSGSIAGAVVIVHDVSEWRRLETMRSEFVANVSHELQTPVTAVKGFAETLLDGALNDPAACASFVQIIYDESDRLGRLVADLLQLSRMESRRPPLHLEETNLSGIISQTIDKLRLHAERSEIQLSNEVGARIFPVTVDPDRIQQVLVNLVANAIAYTPSGGSVRITAEVSTDRITVHVIDSGIGIEERHIPRLFERFYRVDQARSRRSGGTGLGLAIAKHIVEAHGGTISVHSVPGKGSDFYFSLPRRHVEVL